MSKLFGTDGIRGVANSELTPELAMKVGKATVSVLSKKGVARTKILIGKDTRVSSDMLESALAAGICSMGADVCMLGFIPTPAVAYLIKKYNASAGIVVSASHNSMEFNGIKVLGPEGFKLADELEEAIEEYIRDDKEEKTLIGAEVGSISFLTDAASDYVEYLVSCIGSSLEGIKVAVDCANGAAYDVARKVFSALKINAIFTAVTTDGKNINDNVGSTHLNHIKELTVSNGCDIGIAYDGDADRCLAIDEKGNEIDGDKIIAILAKAMKAEGKLSKDTVVLTVMSNLGTLEFFKNNDIDVATTAVGDRNVLEEMLKNNYSIGGEQSGHVILLEYATTGDGILTSLMLLKRFKESKKKASELASDVPIYPQVLKPVSASAAQKKYFNESEEIKSFIRKLDDEFKRQGRILVRASGTEPVIRVLAEGKNEKETEAVVDAICNKLNEELAGVI